MTDAARPPDACRALVRLARTDTARAGSRARDVFLIRGFAALHARFVPATLGGAQFGRLRETIEIRLRRPDLFRRLGSEPRPGVLFTDPPGVGKTPLARRIAEPAGATFLRIDGPENVFKPYGDGEARLRDVFRHAAAKALVPVFIDDIDAIAPRRDALSGERQLERRVVAQRVTLMGGLDERGPVVAITATNPPEAPDSALRRPGRVDRELAFGAPDAAGPREIVDVHLAGAPLEPAVDLDPVAEDRRGVVDGDLAALAREVAVAAIGRPPDAAVGLAAVEAASFAPRPEEFDAGRACDGPNARRGAAPEPPDADGRDAGDRAEAKRAPTEASIRPPRHPALLRRLGVVPPSGIRLAGPPGSGKALPARALAGESGVDVLPATASRPLSRHFCKAERAAAEIFARARHAARAILFLDELDAPAPRRGAALDCGVAQRLVEIDGIERRPGVFVLAAANRPEAVDPVLTRPGRLGLLIPLGPPDEAARAVTPAVQTRALPSGEALTLAPIAARRAGWNGAGWNGADLRALAQGAAQGAPPPRPRGRRARPGRALGRRFRGRPEGTSRGRPRLDRIPGHGGSRAIDRCEIDAVLPADSRPPEPFGISEDGLHGLVLAPAPPRPSVEALLGAAARQRASAGALVLRLRRLETLHERGPALPGLAFRRYATHSASSRRSGTPRRDPRSPARPRRRTERDLTVGVSDVDLVHVGLQAARGSPDTVFTMRNAWP